jgi:hypothetical protein
MTKLTLSMDEDVVATAKRLASQQNTSVSAMLASLIRAMAAQDLAPPAIPPDSVTARLTGIVTLPADRSDRDLLTDALAERYGIVE